MTRQLYLKLRWVRHGFTLVELMVVVAVLGIIAAIVMSIVLSQPERANRSRILADLQVLDQSTQMYITQKSGNPASINDLVNAGFVVASPGPVGKPDVSYMAWYIRDMDYNLRTVNGVYRACLSGTIYVPVAPSAGTASVFTIEQLLNGGW